MNVNVIVGVGEGISVVVGLAVPVDVEVEVAVAIPFGVKVDVGVFMDVEVAVTVSVGVKLPIGVFVVVGLAVPVGVEEVGVGVLIEVAVPVGVEVISETKYDTETLSNTASIGPPEPKLESTAVENKDRYRFPSIAVLEIRLELCSHSIKSSSPLRLYCKLNWVRSSLRITIRNVIGKSVSYIFTGPFARPVTSFNALLLLIVDALKR